MNGTTSGQILINGTAPNNEAPKAVCGSFRNGKASSCQFQPLAKLSEAIARMTLVVALGWSVTAASFWFELAIDPVLVLLSVSAIGLVSLALCGTTFVFIQRAQVNLKALGVNSSPSWLGGSWLDLSTNILSPFHCVRETYRLSVNKKARLKWAPLAWWVCWLLSLIAGNFLSGSTVIFTLAINLAALSLFVLIANQISSAQTALHRQATNSRPNDVNAMRRRVYAEILKRTLAKQRPASVGA